MPNNHISIPRIKYQSGCIMIYLKYYNLQFIQSWVPDNHLYEDRTDAYGYVSEPHITLLNGIENGVSLHRIEKALRSLDIPDSINFETKLSVFPPNDKGATALKFDVIDTDSLSILTGIHKALRGELPNRYEYDVYKPHMTVAFIKEKFIPFYDTNTDSNNIISHTLKSKQRSNGKTHQPIPTMYSVYTTSAGDKFIIDN
jgi:hypothetical protein